MHKIRTSISRLHTSEQGSLSIYLLLLVVVLVGVIGFVVDSSGKYQADAAAQQTADNAARAAANSIGGNTISTGSLSINAGQAETVGREYLSAAGVAGTVAVNGELITVTVTSTYQTKFLSIFGADTLPTHGQATARLLTQ